MTVVVEQLTRISVPAFGGRLV